MDREMRLGKNQHSAHSLRRKLMDAGFKHRGVGLARRLLKERRQVSGVVKDDRVTAVIFGHQVSRQ